MTRWRILGSFVLVIFLLFTIALLRKGKVIKKVNYVAEYNKITKPANYDPNENAAPYYEKAFAVLVDMPNDIQDIRKIWPVDMNESQLDNVKNWLSSNAEAIENLKPATQKPYYWVERHAKGNFLMAVEMPELRKFRYACYCLDMQAKLMAAQGQIEPALQLLVDLYKMGTHLRDTKTLVEQLVGIAVEAYAVQTGFEILDKIKPNSALLKNFQEQLQTISSEAPSTIDYSVEKLISYDCIQRFFTDDGKGGGHVYGTRFFEKSSHAEYFLGADWTRNRKKDLKNLKRQQTVELTEKVYDYLNNIQQKTPYQLHKENSDSVKVLTEMTKDDPMWSVIAPALVKVLTISYRCKTDTEASITTVAILRYKNEKNEYPATLEELVTAGYIKEIPIDPFSGEPLVYKRTVDNFILYSVGENFTDDGGMHSEWGTDKGDYVFWPVQNVEPEKQN